MKTITTAFVGFLFTFIFSLQADPAPQDSWYLDREIKLPEMPGFRKPLGITIDSNGKSYVVDQDNHTITVWDQNGTFLRRFGTHGSGDGQLSNPADIEVTQNEIYVVEKGNHRVQVFDKNGTYLRKWGSYGTGQGELRTPLSITLGFNGSAVDEVFVADWDNHGVQVYDENGTFKRFIGGNGSANNQFNFASGVAIGPDGLLYAASRNHNKIKVFETNGTYVRSFTTIAHPSDIDFHGDKLAIGNNAYNTVKIFDKNGTEIGSIGTHNVDSSAPGEFKESYGLSYSSNGELHVADHNNHRIQVFDSNNSYIRSYGMYGEAGVGPYGLQITPQNTFLITDVERHRVFEIDENGSFLRMTATHKPLSGYGLNNPRSAFLAPDNRVYIADTAHHRIQVYERNGTFVRKFGTSGSSDGNFNEPYAVIVSPELEIFVADNNNHRVQVFDTNGTFLRKFGSYGTLEGQMRNVYNIAFSDEGNVVVGDWHNKRLIHFTKAGEFIKHFSTQEHPRFVKDIPHGLTAVSRDSRIELYDANGAWLKNWTKPGGSTSAFDTYPDGTIAWLDYDHDKILFYKPTYRTVRPAQSKEIPLPQVLNVAQPNNTNHLQVTYRINDPDSAKVEAKMIAFIDGGNDISKVIIPTTFIGSTAGKLDDNVSTNQDHNITWNVGADWSVGFGELEVAIMAKDDRNLLNLHFLTLPGTDDNTTELKINRSPITEADLLDLWYWLLASGEQGIVFNPQTSTISKPAPDTSSSSFDPSSHSNIVLWLDASDSQSLTLSEETVTQWDDKSGNQRHALSEGGTPKFSTTGGINGLACIQFRRDNGEDYLQVSGSEFFARHMFFICRSPHESWSNYGGILGHQSGRNSNFLFQSGNKGFHSNQNPSFVSRNGQSMDSKNDFDLATINQFMILEIVVNANDTSPKSNYKVGRNDNYTTDFDVIEILAFEYELGGEREDVLQYLSYRSGISILGQALVQGAETTAIGRAYLFDKMNLREASPQEVTRAKNGSVPGTTNQFTPTLQVGPGARPNKVNEYGFDTGSTSGAWVTPK